jgi:hypothetical protein
MLGKGSGVIRSLFSCARLLSRLQLGWFVRSQAAKIRLRFFLEFVMNHLFNKTALPITLVVGMIVWAWVSFLSVAVSSLF